MSDEYRIKESVRMAGDDEGSDRDSGWSEAWQCCKNGNIEC